MNVTDGDVATRPGRRPPAEPPGFALVVAVALTSFLLLLVVGLASVVSVESGATGVVRSSLLARQNALLGIHLALGELQRHAGPDQRVTARADILAADIAHPYWTGVWDTTAPAAPPRWLVSGNPPDAGIPLPPADGVEMWRPDPDAATSSSDVTVPRVPVDGIGGSPGNPAGSYAYWVSDEGVKASFGIVDRIDRIEGAPFDSERGRKHLRQQMAPRFWIEAIIPDLLSGERTNDTGNPLAVAEQERFAVPIFRSGEFVIPVVRSEPVTEIPKALFHDLTNRATAVIANTVTGGLRHDLSDPRDLAEPEDPVLMVDDAVREFLRHRPRAEDSTSLEGAGIGEPGETGVNRATAVAGRSQVITEFDFSFGIYNDDDRDNGVFFTYGMRIDIWNPYSLPVEFNRPADPSLGIGEETDFYVRILGFPAITVNYRTGDPEDPARYDEGTFTLEMTAEELTIPVDARQSQADEESNYIRAPGQVRMEQIWRRSDEERNWIPKTIPVSFADPTPARAADDTFDISIGEADLTIELVDLDGQVVQRFRGYRLEESGTEAAYRWTDSISYNDLPLAIYFKFEESTEAQVYHGQTHMEMWASLLDPRGPVFDFSDEMVQRLIYFEPNPLLAASIEESFPIRPEFFYGGNPFNRSGNFHRFFDLPVTEVVSLGNLQHLHLSEARPFAMGNGWGGAINAVFDQYFLSTLPFPASLAAAADDDRIENAPWGPVSVPDTTEEGRSLILPNTRLAYRGDSFDSMDDLMIVTGPGRAAEHFLIDGAFNFNSTSVGAWTALLAGNNLFDWKYRFFEYRETLTKPRVNHAFFRSPHGADRQFSYPYEDFDQYPAIPDALARAWFRDDWAPRWARAYTVAMREFELDSIRELAEEMVRQTRRFGQREGRPLVSFEEWLTASDGGPGNTGIPQQAIDNTTLNTFGSVSWRDENPGNRLPLNAPAFVSQADLMNSFAPVLTPRSDLFLIRSRGDAGDRVTGGRSGHAWCEAMVRRIPERVDGNADIFGPAPEFGRVFEVIYFRWLRESEI